MAKGLADFAVLEEEGAGHAERVAFGAAKAMAAKEGAEKAADALEIEILVQFGALQAEGTIEITLGVAEEGHIGEVVGRKVALGFCFRTEMYEGESGSSGFDHGSFFCKLGDRLAAEGSTKVAKEYEQKGPLFGKRSDGCAGLALEGAQQFRVRLICLSEHGSVLARTREAREGFRLEGRQATLQRKERRREGDGTRIPDSAGGKAMRRPWILLGVAAAGSGLLFVGRRMPAAESKAPARPVVLRASLVLDGRGHFLRDTRVVIENGKIARIDPKAEGALYDLRGLTVMPGWIDTHVHIGWHFGADGRLAGEKEPREQAALAAAANAWKTLTAGFTTVQSVGSPADKDLREAVAHGGVLGPRIMTSLEPIVGRSEASGTPDELRAMVRQRAEQGADVIKIFASKSIREGAGQTLSQEQLAAACGEARRLGLRTVVHAYGPAVGAAALAGCTQVEHGVYATDEDLRLMAENGTFFDPQAGLVIQNYLDNKEYFLGIGNYTEEGFAIMQKILPKDQALFRRAVATRGLKIVFGTDAVAGAHGRNAEEFVYRVKECGQEAMAALVSAQSLAAESLGMGEKLGAIAPGMEGDIIALEGNPLEDITAVRRVVFVMKGGMIVLNRVQVRAAQ